MNPIRKEKWAKKREKGILRYLLVNGLLYIGTPLAVTFWLLADFASNQHKTGFFYRSPEFWTIGAISIAIIYGVLFAAISWRANETFFSWEEKRTEGLLRYVMVEGILFKGLPLVLLISILVFNPVLVITGLTAQDITFSSIAKFISLGILLGTMYGFSTWYSSEACTFWSKTRTAGKASFVLKNGLFLYGWPYAIAMTSFNYLIKYKQHPSLEDYLFSTETLVFFGFYAVFFGIIMGFISWSENEKAFAKPDSASMLKLS